MKDYVFYFFIVFCVVVGMGVSQFGRYIENKHKEQMLRLEIVKIQQESDLLLCNQKRDLEPKSMKGVRLAKKDR